MWLTAFNILTCCCHVGRVPGSTFLSNQTQSPLFSTMETPKLKNIRATQRACWSRYTSCFCWGKIHHCASFCHPSSRELLSSPTKPPSESGMSWFQLPFSGWIMYRDLTIGANSTEEKKGQPSIILLINPSLHAFLSRSIAVSLSSISLFSLRRIMIIIVCFGTFHVSLPASLQLFISYVLCLKVYFESLWSSFLSSLLSWQRDILSCVLRLCLPFVFLWNSCMHQSGHWQGVWW